MSEVSENTDQSKAGEAKDKAKRLYFDARLTPHRSLSPRGFIVLMSAVCLVSFAAGLGFFLAGAWPVIGFLGIDVLLIYLAFRINYRSGRICEVLQLTADELKVIRTNYWGEETSWSFQPYWLQVFTENPRSSDCRILLRSHGNELQVASFLSATERLEFAEALKEALARTKQPQAEQLS